MKTLAMILGALLLTFLGFLLLRGISRAISGIKRESLKEYLSYDFGFPAIITTCGIMGALLGVYLGFIEGGFGGLILGLVIGIIVGVAILGFGVIWLILFIRTNWERLLGALWLFGVGLAIFGALIGVAMVIESLWGVGQP